MVLLQKQWLVSETKKITSSGQSGGWPKAWGAAPVGGEEVNSWRSKRDSSTDKQLPKNNLAIKGAQAQQRNCATEEQKGCWSILLAAQNWKQHRDLPAMMLFRHPWRLAPCVACYADRLATCLLCAAPTSPSWAVVLIGLTTNVVTSSSQRGKQELGLCKQTDTRAISWPVCQQVYIVASPKTTAWNFRKPMNVQLKPVHRSCPIQKPQHTVIIRSTIVCRKAKGKIVIIFPRLTMTNNDVPMSLLIDSFSGAQALVSKWDFNSMNVASFKHRFQTFIQVPLQRLLKRFKKNPTVQLPPMLRSEILGLIHGLADYYKCMLSRSDVQDTMNMNEIFGSHNLRVGLIQFESIEKIRQACLSVVDKKKKTDGVVLRPTSYEEIESVFCGMAFYSQRATIRRGFQPGVAFPILVCWRIAELAPTSCPDTFIEPKIVRFVSSSPPRFGLGCASLLRVVLVLLIIYLLLDWMYNVWFVEERITLVLEQEDTPKCPHEEGTLWDIYVRNLARTSARSQF